MTAFALALNVGTVRADDDWNGGGRDDSGDSDSGSFDDKSASEAAFAAACGFAQAPSGTPLTRDGEVKDAWKWEEGKKATKIDFTASKARKASYKNPLCEQFVLMKIEDSLKYGKKEVVARCERIRDDLFASNEELRKGGGAGGASGFSLRSAIGGGRSREDEDDSRESACESRDDAADDFACDYLDHRDLLDDDGAQRSAAKEILSFCKANGADMTISWDTYSSYTGAGLDSYGGGYCGNRGGPIVVRKENKWYDTLGNVVLGMTKVLAPVASMTYISHLQQENAARAIDANKALGFPSAVSAGSSGMYGVYGGGGACHGGGMYGGSGCGGWGCGGGIGAGCAGGGMYGGGLPYGGGCYAGGIGNCGGVVGGGVGSCGGGVPYPYGGGGCGGFYGGGLGGVVGGGCAYTGLGGGCPYGGAYGNGGIVVGGTGMGPYGGAYGGGMCGVPPYSGTGCAGQYPGGFPGVGYPYGNGTGNNLLNPYGTVNGANGIGSPWGANGQYGAAPYWGANNPMNANYMAQQAQMYQQWATQMGRQAQQSAQYARLYQDNMKDLQKVQEKAYQSYAAYQQASMGIAYGGGMGLGGGGYGGGWGSTGGYAQYNGASYAPTYYPPYNSGTNNRISFGFSYNGVR
jgi:hypothetical protein